MKFNDYKYEKINIDETKEKFSNLIKSFSDAENLEEQTKYMDEIIKLRNHIDTMETLVSIRHSIDTTDEFYDKENEYVDEISPILFGLFMVSFLKSYLVTLENLNAVNKNQEKYREEYGYTIEEWYGKKSKMYKEYVKKSKKR